MSTFEVDKIIPQSGTNLQVGEASDTIKVPSGATLDIESGATLDATGATITGFDAASDEKVKVTANDTTPGFLTTKVLAGTNISLTVGNASNNETLTAAFTGNLNASITNAGTFADARIPNLNASKITAGTLDAGRIPNLNASKINAGTIATARLGSGTASSSTFLRGDQTYATPAGGVTFKEGGTNFTNSLLVGQNSTGTLSSAEGNVGVGPGVFESKLKAPIAILFDPVVLMSKALNPTATFWSPVVNAPKTPIQTPVFPSAAFKVPVVSVPTNKLFVKFVPPSLKVMPALDKAASKTPVLVATPSR